MKSNLVDLPAELRDQVPFKWLLLPEYAAELTLWLEQKGKSAPPRSDWPVDKRDLVQRYNEIGSMALNWAVENFRKSREIAKLEDGVLTLPEPLAQEKGLI